MRTFLLCFCVFSSVIVFGQPGIQWQKSLGGFNNDVAYSVVATTDGGCIMAGSTDSYDNDVNDNHGVSDYWVVKLDVSGTLQWKKTFGGAKNDFATCIQQTADGGYIVAGYSASEVADHHNNVNLPQNFDYWILKLDVNGNIVWQKSFGGERDDVAKAVKQTTDGGYIVVGYTESTGGDVTNNKASRDAWIVKLDTNGTLQWQKDLGGSLLEYANDVKQTFDGGYIIAANAISSDGDLSGVTHPGGGPPDAYDYWVIKLNAAGGLQWQKCYGGRYVDEAASIDTTSDGGYVVVGHTTSNNGNVSGNHGDVDGWIIKLDATGSLQWQRCLGGNITDYVKAVNKTSDGNYIVAGYTYSKDGDIKGGNHSPSSSNTSDAWMIKISSLGGILWQKAFGGPDYDYNYAVTTTSDKGYFFAGASGAIGGDVTIHRGYDGYQDLWVVRLKPDTSLVKQTITFPTLSDKFVGAADFALTATASSGLPITYTSSDTTVATIVSGNKIHIKKDGTTNITATQAGDNNFAAAASVTRLLTVNKVSQTITFSALANKFVGNPDFVLTGTASSGLPISYTSSDTTVATIVSGNKVHIKKEGTTNITAAQAGNNIYVAATSVLRTLTVNKIPQSITFPLLPNMAVGDPDFTLTATASSGLPISYTSSDTTVATIVGSNTVHIKKAGTTNIIAAQPGNNTYAAATSIINFLQAFKRTQTITFAHLSPRFMGTPDFALTATASSGLPVSYTSSDTTVATIINGNTIHILKAGTTIITATQAGNDIYLAATAVTSAFVVNKVSQTITFTNFTDKTYGSPDFDLGAFTSSHLPVSYTIADTNVISLVAGKAHIKKAGITNVTALQAGNDTFATATPVTIQLTIYKSAQTITFTAPGAHNILEGSIGLSATASSGMAVTYTSSDTSIASVAGNSVILKKAGTVSITALQAGDNNYTAASQPRQLVISGFRISTYYQYICTGTPLTFTVNAPNAPAGITYQWQKNGNNVGDNSPQYIDSTLQNNTLIQCIATFNGRSYTSNAFNIGVITPVVTVTGPGVVCQASAATYNVKVNNNLGGGILGYQWKKNNINVGYNQNYYIDEHINANDSIWCTIITDAACKASEALTSNKIVVNVLPLGTVAATVTYQPFNYKLCAPGDTTSIVFHAVGQYGGANPSFQWMMNNQAIGTGSSYYTGHGLKAGDKIYCRYTSTQKCVTDDVHVVQSNTVTLSAKTPLTPAITIAQNPTGPVCHGDSVRFKVSSIYGSGSAPVYQWMKNNIKVGTNSDVYYDNDLLIGDSVWCTMKTDYPCAVSPIVASNKIKLVVNYTTPLIPSAINGPATVRANQKDVGYLVNRVNDVTYLWSVPAGATIRSGLHINEALINWGTTGGTLVVQARNGCGYSERSRLVVTVTPGLQSLDGFEEASTISGIASGKAQLYPNPATTNTTVSFTATEAGKYMVQVVDANGRILQVKETNAIKGRNTININVSGYAKGSYFVRLTNKDGRQQATFTLVVAK